MEYEDFLEVLQQLSVDNEIPLDEFKQTMIEAGIPSGAADMVIVK